MTRILLKIALGLVLSAALISCNGGDKFVGTWESDMELVYINKAEGGRYEVSGTPLSTSMMLKYKGGALTDGEKEIVIYKPEYDQIFVNGATLDRRKDGVVQEAMPVDDTLGPPLVDTMPGSQ